MASTDFGVAQLALQELQRCRLGLLGLPVWASRHALAPPEHQHPLQAGKAKRHPAQHRMQHEQHRQIDGRPGQVKEALMPGPVMNWRSSIRSCRPQLTCPVLLAARWDAKLASKTGCSAPGPAASWCDQQSRPRPVGQRHDHQQEQREQADTISKVSSLRLSSTRSKTCNMYSVGTSISRLTTALNRPPA
jgi:hypothetical protein